MVDDLHFTVSRLLLESIALLYSIVAMLTLQQCTGLLPPLPSGVFYNQKKMVFLPVYRRVLLLSLGFIRRPQCPTSFFPPQIV